MAPRRAGPGRRGVRTPEKAHAQAATLVCAYGAATSILLCDGGRPNTAAEFFRCAGAHAVYRATLAQTLAGAAHGGNFSPAVHSRGAGEFGGAADGKNSGQRELHGIE